MLGSEIGELVAKAEQGSVFVHVEEDDTYRVFMIRMTPFLVALYVKDMMEEMGMDLDELETLLERAASVVQAERMGE